MDYKVLDFMVLTDYGLKNHSPGKDDDWIPHPLKCMEGGGRQGIFHTFPPPPLKRVLLYDFLVKLRDYVKRWGGGFIH